MKIGFVFVLYKTLKNDIDRLKKEVSHLGIRDYEIYFFDNTYNKKSYAYGVNQGIKKALKDNCQIIAAANPDISLKDLIKKDFLKAGNYFDIWGYSLNQEGKTYYGGFLDKWRLSGGLSEIKPKKRFVEVDFVSGSLIFFKKKVIEKISFWDESYFLYYEEVDFCYRAKKAGFKVGIDSYLKYDHFEVSKSNPEKEFYLFKNHYKFFLKYSNFLQKIREFIRLPKTIIENIKKRSFYLNFFSLNLFSVINKLLAFVLFLVLTRTFKPDIYGIYTLVWSHISLFLPLLDFGTTTYGLAKLNQEERNLNQLISLRFFLGLGAFFISNIMALVFPYSNKIKLAIFLISIVYLSNSLSGSYLILSSIRQKSYLQGLINLIFQTFLVISSIIIVLLTKTINQLFYGLFFIYLSYFGVNLYLLKKNVINFKILFNINSLLSIIKGSVIFLLINLFAGWYSKIDVFLLNFLKGSYEVGIYSSAYKFLDGLMFFVTAYNLSSIPLFSYLKRNNQIDLIKLKVKKDFFLLLIIGLSTSLFFFFFGEIVFLLLKKDYQLALPILKIIIFNLPLILLISIGINVIYAFNKERSIIYLFLFQLIYNFVFNYLLIPVFNYYASAWISLVGEVINLLIIFLIVKKILFEKKGQIKKISLDAGSLNSKNITGNKIFSENLINNLLNYDKNNQYFIYRLNKINFLNIGWLKIQLSIKEFFNKKQVFLALNQAIPFYTSVKVIGFCHGLSYYFFPKLYEKKLLEKLTSQLNQMIKRSDKIVVSSLKVKNELLKINKDLKNKIVINLFGIPDDVLDFKSQVKTRWKRKKYFLVVAQNQKIKNLDFIKKAYKKIIKDKKFKKFKLKIINNEVLRDNLFKWYYQSYCLLTASYYESFNFPIIEALVLGCPVVGLKTAVIPELKDYVNLANSEDDFIKLAKNLEIKPNNYMIKKLVKKFSWKKYIKKIIKLY